jgi:hypothetical protein
MKAMKFLICGVLLTGCTAVVNGKVRRFGTSDDPAPVHASDPAPEQVAAAPAVATRPRAPASVATAPVAALPAPAAAAPPVATDATKAASADVAKGNCQWRPMLVVRQYEGAGKYGPMLDVTDLGDRINPSLYYQVMDSTRNDLDPNDFDCTKVKRIASDTEILRTIRKNKEHPESWLAAHWARGQEWVVETDYGAPVAKSRVVIVYMTKTAD